MPISGGQESQFAAPLDGKRKWSLELERPSNYDPSSSAMMQVLAEATLDSATLHIGQSPYLSDDGRAAHLATF